MQTCPFRQFLWVSYEYGYRSPVTPWCLWPKLTLSLILSQIRLSVAKKVHPGVHISDGTNPIFFTIPIQLSIPILKSPKTVIFLFFFCFILEFGALTSDLTESPKSTLKFRYNDFFFFFKFDNFRNVSLSNILINSL